jgi:wyosine [tRNA(Phe)-imidazoG37] synthetase (radical SAM superfamily)
MAEADGEHCNYVFGPVPSRRLGRSLGVDLVPFKTCTYDCIYCQLGRTTDKTVTRREYVPTADVLQQLHHVLAAGPRPDYVTLAGSGEPTLFAPLGELIAGIKRLTDVPVAVLTNGSLLWQPQVRAELAEADVVVPSLDAGDDRRFQLVNRPHQSLSFADMTEGLVQFAREFHGRLWLEVLLLDGLTAEAEAVEQIAALARRIAPERLQLNTVARPPAESWARPASVAQLEAAATLLGAGGEVIKDYDTDRVGPGAQEGEATVLGLLRRRPCRLEDLSAGLGWHRNEVLKYVGHLLRDGRVSTRDTGGQTYYVVAPE